MSSRFIYVVTYSSIPFFFKAENYSIAYAYHIFSTRSFIDGHLGCFPVLAVVDNAAVNMGVQIFLWDPDITSFRSRIAWSYCSSF